MTAKATGIGTGNRTGNRTGIGTANGNGIWTDIGTAPKAGASRASSLRRKEHSP